MQYAKISVITPSYNQGKFIEQTILSVIGQQYPNLEYIIMDGGSSDETVSIIKKYEQYISYWVSEPDKGQSNAINKGFERATGDILCWLNSDDYYLPGTLLSVNNALNTNQAELLYGNCIHLNEAKNQTHGSHFNPMQPWDINHGDFITQPSSFWTRKAWEQTGPLKEDLHYAFDWEWYARANSGGVKFVPSAQYFSVYRLHDDQKTDSENPKRFSELLKVERQLNPEKFNFIDHYISKHGMGLKLLSAYGKNRRLARYSRFLLKLFYPGLMKRTDSVTLRKYLQHP